MKSKKIILLILILSFLIFKGNLILGDDDECSIQPPSSASSNGAIANPGGDACDDNYSLSSGVLREFNIAPEAVVQTDGYWEAALKLYGGLKFNGESTAQAMLDSTPFVVIPTGALYSRGNDNIFKVILKEYVRLGGTIIVFAQQYGAHIDNVVPIPQGESLKSYGWREDQSCWSWSYNLKAMHPALAAMAAGSLRTDGQFTVYPSNSTILLRKGSNQEPVLLYYPYGSGTVILTSMYTDWGAAHSQATASELRLVRDIVTFAKNPNLAIPMYDLAANLMPEISMQVKVKNDSEYAATKAKIFVYTPDRKIVLYQTESSVSLAIGIETEIPVSFTLPEMTDVNLGICHTDYELFDSEDNLVQMATEADSGRFTPYRLKLTQTPVKDMIFWLTAESEFVYWDEKPQFTLHVRNNTDHDITSSFTYDWWHGNRIPLTSLTIPGGQTIEYNFEVPLNSSIANWSDVMESFFVHGGPWGNQNATKGIRVVYPSFTNKIQTPSSQIRFGDAINFTINATNTTGKAIPGEMVVKLFNANNGNEVTTLNSQTYGFATGETFNYSGSQSLASPIDPGYYKLQFGIKRPDGKTHYSNAYFSYVRSNVNINLAIIPEAYTIEYYSKRYGLIPGQTYSVNFKLRNYSLFPISQGRYTVTLKSEGGIEVFRKEAANIAFNASQELAFNEPFDFSPVAGGKYTLQVEYSDESRTAALVTIARMNYEYLMKLEMKSEQAVYHYLDTANIQVKIAAVGAIHIKFNYFENSQERNIEIPVGQNSATEIFQVPITTLFYNPCLAFAEISDSSGKKVQADTRFLTTSPLIAHSASTDALGLKEGTPLNLSLAFTEKSGMTAPFTATLTAASAGLNFNDTQTVIIQPAVANEFHYQIPIAETAAEGLHGITYQLKIGGIVMAQGSTSVKLPPITLRFSEPPATVNSGAPFDLKFENSGGRQGTFALYISVGDEMGKQVMKHEESLTLMAGEKKIVTLSVPEGLKSGKYSLFEKGSHDISGRVFNSTSGIAVSGLTATLNAYTFKEKYFDNEIETGKAEIIAGGNIVNAKLRAKIAKITNGGSKVFKPGEYYQYARTSINAGNSYGDKTFFTTEIGLVELDRNSGKYRNLLSAYNLESIYITSSGELWLTTWGNGIYHRNQGGNWKNYTTDNGLLDNWVWSIIEREKDGQKSVWVATSSGISVFSNSAWSSYTTADGLNSNEIYQFAKDSDGEIWVYSTGMENAIDRFNGSRFEKVNVPFATNNGFYMGYGPNGDIWIISYIYDPDPYTQQYHIWHYTQGNWATLDTSSIPPNFILDNLAEDDGDIWFTGMNYETYNSVLVKFDGTFTIYDGATISEIESVRKIIPVPGWNGLYFGSTPGFVEFSSEQWRRLFIEIDEDKLPGPITCLAGDKQGNVWTAADGWISRMNGSGFTQYISPQGDGINWSGISSLAVGNDGTAYAFVYMRQEESGMGYDEGSRLILKIAAAGSSRIDCPDGLDAYASPVLTVDNIGRLWLVENPCSEGCFAGRVFYFDGVWHTLMDGSGENHQAWTSKIISDGFGGVYFGVRTDNGNANARIIHVQNDLSIQEYPLGGPGFSYNGVKDIHLDSTGVLWILGQQDGEIMTEAVLALQNEILTEKAVSGPWEPTPGYPDHGLWGIGEEGAGNVVFAGMEDTQEFEVSHLYKLNQDGFTVNSGAFYPNLNYDYSNYDRCPIFSDGNFIFSIGDIENSNMNYLLQIGAGISEETIWSADYPVDVNGGASANIDLLPGKTLAAGNYILKSELVSGLDQKLADSQYGFLVRGTAVAASISKSGAADPNVRAGSDQEIKFEVLNNTAEDKPDLTMKVTKLSPAGVETILQEGPLSLTAGQSHNGTLTFNEAETGVWQLNIEIRESNSLLDSAELILQNSEPTVTYEIIHPEYAGDEPFPIKIRMANTGQIPVNVHVLVRAVHEPPLQNPIDEDVALNPGEERILSFTDTITANRVYDITFSGDLEMSEQKTVAYGYVENLALTVLPQYREGGITIGYTVANAGGLPFSSTIHFELFAVGNAIAIYAADKTYNLYPGAEASADSLEFALAPGAYQLRWTTGKGGVGQADFTILPSGIGQLTFAPAAKYPVGLTQFAYTLSNSDTVAGSIPLLIEIVPAAGGAPIYTATRNYYINANESVSDAFSFDFAGNGSYIARISGAKVVGGTVSVPIRVLNLDEVTTGVAVQPASDGAIPVQVNIANTGYNDFVGTLVIEAGGLRHEEPLLVVSEGTLNQAYNFDANGLSSGSQEVKAYLYDAAGNLLTQSIQTVNIMNADIRVIEAPQNLAISAGAFANVTLKVKNEGNRRGEAKITMTAFDTLNETRELVLEAGEEIELNDIYIDVDADIPAGRYPLNYTLSGLGVSSGLAKGNFYFQVNGIALEVTAALDRSLYNEGETAQLTLNISSANPVTTPLEIVVNWNDFSEQRAFILDSGSSSQVFEIPLTEASDAKVFYGIYQEGGRGIYLNDIYLNFSGNVSVTLDQQVYAPGDSIHALFSVGEPGNLTAECFGQSQTIAIGSSGSIAFAVPADALGGSYGVAWTFTPTDLTHESASGSKAFDVSGLVVKVAKAELESGKYAPGDSIKAMLALESNRDISLSLRSWTTTPEGQWTYLGEQNTSLSATQQTPVVLEYAFNTTEAGTHRFVYGLYREEQLIVSGAAAFDCGDAVLLGLVTDHLDYPDGNETVKVKVDYFGAGAASLKLYLDDVLIDERSITLAGLGSVTIDLAAAQISGGRHDLLAVMSKDNLTSTRTAWFGYGSNLPDLVVEMAERSISDLNYTYTIRVSNSGKTAAAASTLVFSDNTIDTQTAIVGALAPAAYQDFQFNWSGSGHAGSHSLRFAVDRENAIKEYVEANNAYELIEEVPALFYKLAIDPQLWPANSNVSIFSRLINNTESSLALQLHLTLTHNASSLSILTRDKTVTLSPYTTTLETDIFNTGTFPVGDYTLRQTANSTAGELTEELPVIIEASKVISGTMTVTPTTVAAGTESQVSLQLLLRNSGNVALENEPLTITMTNNESQEVVKSESLTVTLALGESKTVVHDLALNLAAGAYTISLGHLDNVVAQTGLTAANGLDKDKYVSRRARVLFMNLLNFPYASQKNYLKSVLSAGNILYQDTANIVESFLHYQKGEHNINVVFGKLPTPDLQKELKERVQRGEGLIYIVDSAANGGILEELGGVNVRNVPAPQREKNITLLPGLLGSGGSAVLPANCKLMLELVHPEVQVIGETKNGKKPLLAYREYGRGKVLTICAPLEFVSGGNVFAQMLLNAVNLFNRDVFSASDLARVMPLELRFRNNTSADKVFRVQELIPQTATAYGFNPQPLAGEGIKWDINLKVNEEKVIGYWLQLPDAVGTFDIKSEIYDGQQKIDEALLTFEVLQKVTDRVVEIITEINASGDTQAEKALAPLNRIENRSGDSAVTLLLNLNDAIQAADLVGKSTIDEAKLWRQKLQNVIMVFARKLADQLNTLSALELNAFGKRFQE